MSNKSKANSIFGDLLDDEQKEELGLTGKTPTEPTSQFLVYFPQDGKPDVAFIYYHKPEEGGRPYARRYGYWMDEGDSGRKFVKLETNNLILMDFETFTNNAQFFPNKNCIKMFDDEGCFLLELI